MKRRRQAPAPLHDGKCDRIHGYHYSDKKISVFLRFRSLLRHSLQVSRHCIAASILLLSSLGVILLVVLFRSSNSRTRVALRSNQQNLSDRAVCLQILQQLVTKHGRAPPRAYIQALEASTSAYVAQTRASGYYIEYKASRGLGHRMTRAAAAYHCEFRLFTVVDNIAVVTFNL